MPNLEHFFRIFSVATVSGSPSRTRTLPGGSKQYYLHVCVHTCSVWKNICGECSTVAIPPDSPFEKLKNGREPDLVYAWAGTTRKTAAFLYLLPETLA